MGGRLSRRSRQPSLPTRAGFGRCTNVQYRFDGNGCHTDHAGRGRDVHILGHGGMGTLERAFPAKVANARHGVCVSAVDRDILYVDLGLSVVLWVPRGTCSNSSLLGLVFCRPRTVDRRVEHSMVETLSAWPVRVQVCL